MVDFQHLAKKPSVIGFLKRALADTIVTISNIANNSFIYQNFRMLCNSRYKLINSSFGSSSQPMP